MRNLKHFLSAFILVTAFVGVFALTLMPTFGQSTGDQLAYLPNIRLDLTPTPTITPTPSCTFTSIESSDLTIEDSVVQAVQDARTNLNFDALNRLDNIRAAARAHSQDMAQNNFVGHRGTDGNYGPQRLREYCYDVIQDQEIVWGGTYSDTKTIIDSWMDNSDWRNAILNEDIKDFGVGYISIERDESEVEEGQTPAEDYFTVSFGYTSSATRSSGIQCQIELENEYGKGVLTTSDPTICNGYYQD